MPTTPEAAVTATVITSRPDSNPLGIAVIVARKHAAHADWTVHRITTAIRNRPALRSRASAASRSSRFLNRGAPLPLRAVAPVGRRFREMLAPAADPFPSGSLAPAVQPRGRLGGVSNRGPQPGPESHKAVYMSVVNLNKFGCACAACAGRPCR
eukprot:scaffold1396_cov116-Isochrysis_galbana.AAC.4